MVYESSSLELVHTVVLDVSPAVIIPHYDEDSRTLFLTGKVITKNSERRSRSHFSFPVHPAERGRHESQPRDETVEKVPAI